MNRRWDVTWMPWGWWRYHLLKPYGKPKYGGVFLTESWIGPLRLRVWRNPKSAWTKAFRVAHMPGP